MVGKAGKTERAVAAAESMGFQVIEPTPPAGARIVASGQASGFFNFDHVGAQLQGTLIGTQDIENTQGNRVPRWVLLPEGASAPVILPDHYDLNARLTTLVGQGGGRLPRRIWIQYLGKVRADVRAGFLHRYSVATLEPSEQEELPF